MTERLNNKTISYSGIVESYGNSGEALQIAVKRREAKS